MQAVLVLEFSRHGQKLLPGAGRVALRIETSIAHHAEIRMQVILYALGFGAMGYLSGSLPFAIWITRLVKGVDVRAAGSGHATATNTIRQAGFLPGALVFVLDVAKGCVPTWLALHYAPAVWIAPLTATLAVIGHCWSVFAGFRGGMGLATANGGMMAAFPFAIIITYAMLGLLILILRHSARASVITGILFAPLLWLVGQRGPVLWIAAATGLVVACRFLIDWNRKYRELWLDREKKSE
jgi:glycerol-3-phosphate acyltransferase PlsY